MKKPHPDADMAACVKFFTGEHLRRTCHASLRIERLRKCPRWPRTGDGSRVGRFQQLRRRTVGEDNWLDKRLGYEGNKYSFGLFLRKQHKYRKCESTKCGSPNIMNFIDIKAPPVSRMYLLIGCFDLEP